MIDPIEADFGIEIWPGHPPSGAIGRIYDAYMVKIYFQRKYVELYTKRKLLT